MRRRDFAKTLLGGAIGAGLEASGTTNLVFAQTGKLRVARKNTLMHVGADYHVIEDDGVTSREKFFPAAELCAAYPELLKQPRGNLLHSREACTTLPLDGYRWMRAAIDG